MLQQCWCAPDVVGMVVGLQNGFQLQLPCFKPCDHGLSHGRIHHDGLAAPDPNPDDVVAENRQLMDAICRREGITTVRWGRGHR